MARHAIVDNETNRVVNVVIWDGAEWLPPRNSLVIQNDNVGVGDIYDPKTNTFSRPYNPGKVDFHKYV